MSGLKFQATSFYCFIHSNPLTDPKTFTSENSFETHANKEFRVSREMIYSVFVLIMFYVTFFDVRSHCSAVCSASSCVSARGWIWISQIKQSSARNFPHFDFRERVEICCVRWVQRKKFLRWLWGEWDRDFIQPVADWYIQTFRHYPEMTIALQPIASTLPSLHFVRIRGLTNFSNSQSLIFGKISSIVKSGDFIRWLMLRVSFKHTRGRLEFNFVYISLCAKGISLLHCGRKVFFSRKKLLICYRNSANMEINFSLVLHEHKQSHQYQITEGKSLAASRLLSERCLSLWPHCTRFEMNVNKS